MRRYSKKGLTEFKGKEMGSGVYKILGFPNTGDREEFINTLPRGINITYIQETAVMVLFPKTKKGKTR